MWSLPEWWLPHFVLSVYQPSLVGVHAESCQATTMVTTMVTMHSSASYCQQVFPLWLQALIWPDDCPWWNMLCSNGQESCCITTENKLHISEGWLNWCVYHPKHPIFMCWCMVTVVLSTLFKQSSDLHFKFCSELLSHWVLWYHLYRLLWRQWGVAGFSSTYDAVWLQDSLFTVAYVLRILTIFWPWEIGY